MSFDPQNFSQRNAASISRNASNKNTPSLLKNLSWPRVVWWFAVAIAFVLVAQSHLASGFADKPSRGPGDLELYKAEVDQMQTGKNYYDIAASELVQRGYPTRSVFNWRTPFPMILIAKLGVVPTHLILIAVASLMILFAMPALYKSSGLGGVVFGTLGLLGASLPIGLNNAWYLPEVWSGLFVGFSLVLYYSDRRYLAVAMGIVALFLRELAAPYVIVSFLIAKKQKHFAEYAGWCAGGVLYALFYCWHLSKVVPRIELDAIAHQGSWIAYGGAPFLISCVQMNIFLLLIPQAFSAIVLTLALAGWSGAMTDWEKRAAWVGVSYIFAFAVVGMPINQYWGSQIAPLIAIGAAQFVRGLEIRKFTPLVLLEKKKPAAIDPIAQLMA
jgi:hypothetical protein